MKITPNQLTVARIVLAFLTFYLILNPSIWFKIAAFVVFTAAALTDLWDGRLARKGGMITNFGKILDPIADKILILGAFICLTVLGAYPFWVLIPIFIREIGVTVLRLYFLRKNVVVAAEKSGKIKVVTQIVSLGITFFYIVNRDYTGSISGWPDQTGVFLFASSYFCLALATYYSLISGWDFLKKNWRHIYA